MTEEFLQPFLIDWVNNLSKVRNREVIRGNFKRFFDKFEDDHTWDNIIKLIDSHPKRLTNWNDEKRRVNLAGFHLRSSAPAWALRLKDELEHVFVKNAPIQKEYDKGPQHITNIAFIGFSQGSSSYPRHKDGCDVLLVQVIEEIPIIIGKEETFSDEDLGFILRPGDWVWIPRGTYHQLLPRKSRVTFSFGLEGDIDPATYV